MITSVSVTHSRKYLPSAPAKVPKQIKRKPNNSLNFNSCKLQNKALLIREMLRFAKSIFMPVRSRMRTAFCVFNIFNTLGFRSETKLFNRTIYYYYSLFDMKRWFWFTSIWELADGARTFAISPTIDNRVCKHVQYV